VSGDREERNRVLGFPVERHPNTRPPRPPRPAGKPRDPQQPAQPQRRAQAEEPQRILGFPVDWFDGLADVLRPLLRRIRGPRGHG
jgi:hypothetical protein